MSRLGSRAMGAALTAAIVAGSLLTTAAPAFARKPSKDVCADPAEGRVACMSQVVTTFAGATVPTRSPVGYSAAQLRTAYGVLAAGNTWGADQTIAIVAAYNHPTIFKDLTTYNSKMVLPKFPLCTTTITKTCFKVVNQNGLASPLPVTNATWALEISMDVQIAHAICPKCRILLVEATTSLISDIMVAVATAGRMGATVISNSYGGPELEGAFNGVYDQPGVAIVVSSGDYGHGAQSPASLPTVISVGGTTLRLNADKTRLSESAWSGAGSGCSTFHGAQPWQADAPRFGATGCGGARGTSDVSAVADPSTGAAVYDSVKINGLSGWYIVGGTSLSAPVVSGIIALAQSARGCNGRCPTPYPARLAYDHPGVLNDIVDGVNGACTTSMCIAGEGYDGPTGLGTPKGIDAFMP